jgi:hypothetical protein
MKRPITDFSESKTVIKELFDEKKWVKDKFAEHFSQELLELAEGIANAFAVYPQLNDAAKAANTEQAALVEGFMFEVLDNLLVSTKILLIGLLMPSGNLMRQAVEGVALALLCSSKVELEITSDKKKQKKVAVLYWECLKKSDPRVKSYKALNHLEDNQKTLGVTKDAVNRLEKAKTHYNYFSHSGLFGIASRVPRRTEEPLCVGGCFDSEKVEAYKQEIRERIGLCSILPNLIRGLVDSLRHP